MTREMKRRDMAYPIHYADDSLRLSRKEAVKAIVGGFVGLVWMLFVLFVIAIAGGAV